MPIRAPARLGPPIRVRFMPALFRAMAFISFSSGTISGMNDCLAGPENEKIVPWTRPAMKR